MSSTPGSEATTQARCAHQTCACLVSVTAAVVAGGRLYCAPACAQGKGCRHEECHCATPQSAERAN